MTRLFAVMVLIGMFLLGVVAAPVAAQTPGKASSKIVRESKAYLETQQIVRLLGQTGITTPKEFKDRISFSDALEFLDKTTGGRLAIVVDRDGLVSPDADAIIDDTIPIRLKSLPARASVQMLLDRIVAQIPNATYIIRQGRIEIVNVDHTTAAHLIRRPVIAVFERAPLHDVLTDLADLTGLSINLDANVGDKAQTPISVVFRNNVSLEDALVNVTEMAGVRFVVLQNSVYVTTPAAARELEKERERKTNPPVAQ